MIIDIYMDYVIFNGQRIDRVVFSDHSIDQYILSRSQWMRFWEQVKEIKL
jgi:hypothetical protein